MIPFGYLSIAIDNLLCVGKLPLFCRKEDIWKLFYSTYFPMNASLGLAVNLFLL